MSTPTPHTPPPPLHVFTDRELREHVHAHHAAALAELRYLRQRVRELERRLELWRVRWQTRVEHVHARNAAALAERRYLRRRVRELERRLELWRVRWQARRGTP